MKKLFAVLVLAAAMAGCGGYAADGQVVDNAPSVEGTSQQSVDLNVTSSPYACRCSGLMWTRYPPPQPNKLISTTAIVRVCVPTGQNASTFCCSKCGLINKTCQPAYSDPSNTTCP